MFPQVKQGLHVEVMHTGRADLRFLAFLKIILHRRCIPGQADCSEMLRRAARSLAPALGNRCTYLRRVKAGSEWPRRSYREEQAEVTVVPHPWGKGVHAIVRGLGGGSGGRSDRSGDGRDRRGGVAGEACYEHPADLGGCAVDAQQAHPGRQHR